MTELAAKTCEPCRGDASPLKGAALDALHQSLDTGWRVIDQQFLEKEYRFDDFKGALAFTIRVGNLAEEQAHHPDIWLAFGEVRLKLWTHKIDGLTESDFILAAKVDQLGTETA